MKLVTLVFIALCTIAAAAQSNNRSEEIPGLVLVPPGANPDQMNLQIGCPVVFTDVALKTQARYMPVKQDAGPDNSLAFKYKNQSGKQIQSIEIRVELKVKRSIYDLDTTTITRDMTLTGNTADTLPLNVIVYSLGPVTLQQVNYVGGKVWTPKATDTCSYRRTESAEQIAK
jgi:hypothetical protein